MALHWELGEIKDWEELCKVRADDDKWKLNPVTDILIYMTMFVGIHEITEKNHIEFYTRTYLYEKVHGPFLFDADEKTKKSVPYLLTLQDIKDHIGLKTNASPLTKTKVMNALYSAAVDAVRREVRRNAEAIERQDGAAGTG